MEPKNQKTLTEQQKAEMIRESEKAFKEWEDDKWYYDIDHPDWDY